MTIVARLSALLTANTTQFESNLKRANSSMSRARTSWNNDLNRSGRSFSKFNTHVRQSIGSITDLRTQLGGLAIGVASALSVSKIIRYSDTWKELESRLKVTAKNMNEVASVQKRLFDIAQGNAAPLRDVTDAYSKMALAVSDAQKEQIDLVKITELLSKTLLVSGTNAAGAATFFQQFGQAASGDFKAVGQELQTFQDQNAYFVQVLKENLDLGGKTLKKFVADGDLSFEKLANALTSAEQKIRKDAESIPLTVGRALQKLDNALLKFIGQADAIRSSTGSLALVINVLAENFGALATATAGIVAVVGVRLVGALAASATAFVVSTANAYAYQLALARMAGVSSIAATATLGLSAATTTFGAAIAFLGGPVGAAALATIGLIALKTRAAGEAQRSMNKRLEEHRESVQGFIFASKERRKEIEDATRQNIQNLKKELEAVVILFNAYSQKSFSNRFLQNLGSKVGIGRGVKDIVNEGAALQNAIEELEKDLATFESFKGGDLTFGGATGDQDDKEKKKIETIIQGLKDESEQIELQTKLYGEKEAAIERAQEALKIQQQLDAAGIKLTQQQQEEIEKYLDSIERQTALQKEQADQQKELEETERNRKQAIDQLGATFESAFEKAITDGEKLGDVLESLGQDIIRLLTRINITEPLFNAIRDGASSGGGIGGFFSSLFGGSFATGIDYVPHDMFAKIHRGEKVVTAAENRKGNSAGDVMVVVNNNAGADVSANAQDNGNGTELNIMIDKAVAENIGRKGSQTNQALSAMQNRTLIRR